jgi:hypothetical protein
MEDVSMLASTSTSKSRSIAHHLLVSVAVVLALGLALSGTAYAKTEFQASITGVTPKPMPCPDGYSLCGTAITTDGPAAWGWLVTGGTPVSNACTSYQATTTFVLGDGSTLVLDENGTACQPGNAFSAPGGNKSFGNPFTVTGIWTVQNANGQFGSITGPGTDTLQLAGAHIVGSYTAMS